MTARNSSVFLFDDIRVDPATFQAFKAEQVISLEPKTLRLLLFLIENRGRLIEKDEILDAIWTGTHVTLSPVSLRWDPRLNELRGDARFQEFARRTGLPR